MPHPIRGIQQSSDDDFQPISVNLAKGVGALPFLLEDFAGVATWAGKPIYNHQQVIGQLDSGARMDTSDNVFTFAFADFQHALGLNNNPSQAGQIFGEGQGYSPFSAAERTVAREAIVLWDDLIQQRFVEVQPAPGASSWGRQQVDIWFANTTTGPGQAWGYYPGGSDSSRYDSDVWTADPSVNWSNGWLGYGDYGRTTLVHELGHTIGLSHPGDYDAGDDDNNDGVPDPITYAADAYYAQDTTQYTIMSYFSPQLSGSQPINVSIGIVNNAQTPLLHDILAIQNAYGADPTTRSGNTNYFSNSNAGNAVYDLSQNPFPFLSVYDAGGEDTFDFSTANSGVFIDLRPGSFSSATAGYQTMEQANAAITAFNAVTDAATGDFDLWTHTAADPNNYEDWVAFVQAIGASRVGSDTGISGIGATSHRNISIAYNTIIENANGGSARDYLVGNDVANKLNGNGGNDVLNGLGGNDILTGGAGADDFRFFQNSGNDTITDFTTGADRIRLTEIDANTNAASDQAFTFIGNAAFSNTAGQLRTYSQGGHNFVAGDVNGDGVADFSIDVGGASVVVTDFFL